MAFAVASGKQKGRGVRTRIPVAKSGGYAPITSRNQDFYKCKVAWLQGEIQCETPLCHDMIHHRLHADLWFPTTVRHLP